MRHGETRWKTKQSRIDVGGRGEGQAFQGEQAQRAGGSTDELVAGTLRSPWELCLQARARCVQAARGSLGTHAHHCKRAESSGGRQGRPRSYLEGTHGPHAGACLNVTPGHRPSPASPGAGGHCGPSGNTRAGRWRAEVSILPNSLEARRGGPSCGSRSSGRPRWQEAGRPPSLSLARRPFCESRPSSWALPSPAAAAGPAAVGKGQRRSEGGGCHLAAARSTAHEP